MRRITVKQYLSKKIANFQENYEPEFIPMNYAPRQPDDQLHDYLYIDELYRDNRQFVLIGPPGVGKSAVLRHLFTQIALNHLEDANEPIPLWIDLRHLDNPIDAEEMFRYWCEQLDLDYDEEKDKYPFPFVLLLDGLNEMPIRQRKERADSLRNWLEKNYDVRVIITCRVRDYEDDPDVYLGQGVKQFDVERFSESQIAAYLSCYSNPYVAKELMHEINRDDAIRELAQTPLHLKMLSELKIWGPEQLSIQRRIPKRTKTLFEAYLEMRYNYEKNEKDLQLELDDLKEKLGNLAYEMVARDKESAFSAPRDWVENKIIGPQTLKDAFNLDLLFQNGRSDEPTIQFRHQSMHGYFALPHLLDSLRRSSQRWALFARPAQTAAIIRQIGDLGDAAEMTVKTLLPLVKHKESIIQTAAINALINIGIPSIPPLIEELDGEDEFMIEKSTHILIEIGEPILGPLLIDVLKSNNPAMRRRTADILDELRTRGAEVPLPFSFIRDLRDNRTESSDFKGHIAEVLGQIRSKQAMQPLIPLLHDEEDYEVRADIAQALGRIGHRVALPHLLKMIKNEETEFARNYAFSSVYQIIARMYETIPMADSKERREIETALCYLFDEERVGVYKILCVRFRNENAKELIAESLRQVRSRRTTRALIRLLSHDDDDLRADAAWMLGHIGHRSALSHLTGMIKRERTDSVWKTAFKAVCQITAQMCWAIKSASTNRSERREIVQILRSGFRFTENEMAQIRKAMDGSHSRNRRMLYLLVENFLGKRFGRYRPG